MNFVVRALALFTCLIAIPATADDQDDAVKALIETSLTDVDEIRLFAIQSLGQLNSDRDDVIVALKKSVDDDELEIKTAAFSAYLTLDISREAKAKQLVDWMRRDTDDDFATVVDDTLIGYPEGAIPLLIELLDSNMEPNEVKQRILVIIGRWGAIAKEAVPILVKTYDRTPELQTLILETLGEMGTDAKSALPVFTKALKSEEPETRAVAAIKVQALLATASPLNDSSGSRGRATSTSQQVGAMFRMFDSDSDGVLSAEESKGMPNGLNTTLDRDSDGTITKQEVTLYYMLRDRSRRSSSSAAFGRSGRTTGGGLTRPATRPQRIP